MNTPSARSALPAALVAVALLAASWGSGAFAYSGGHSGGGHGGGGHGGGGPGGGGAHFSGGSHSFGGGTHFSGGSHSFGGAAHVSAPARMASVGAGSAHFSAPAARGFAARPGGYAGTARAVPGRVPAVARPGYPARGAGFHGRGFGPGYGHFAHWGGGYWGGRFWPAAYYGPGFAWFLASIPLYCATFWWNSVPYYYYNDIYYTWSPAADGYVATDPPPAGDTPPPANDAGTTADGAYPAPADSDGAAAQAPTDAATAENSPPPDAIAPGQFAVGRAGSDGGGDHVFAYPANGQSEQQQARDRTECDQWAASQAGSAGSSDYHRAVIACFQGRGYSAQ